jgi:hypothetical protein
MNDVEYHPILFKSYPLPDGKGWQFVKLSGMIEIFLTICFKNHFSISLVVLCSSIKEASRIRLIAISNSFRVDVCSVS